MAAAAERGAELPAEPPRGVRPPLGPEEVAKRLESTRRELSNRRKILLRNLPAESSSQEIHDLFKDYEIKYCYVDRNKRTAFVTLLNGEQAQSAIRKYHQYSLRGKEISVQLQPTDALLCITNLPISFTLEEFEELVRAYGNVERCFLVYNEVTGHSKGYGFVEYMKKDSAAKARLELLGKQLEESTLFAQWMDVNQLTTNLIHSKCLCVEKFQKDCADSKELIQAFSLKYKPVFCQFAQDEDSNIGDFAVVEYETAEQAEKVQELTDGMTIKGKRVQVSYCAPGAPGRSTLAALIAAQRMMRNNRKGLLPEPNPVQIMKSFNNPAMLQMLLQPQLRGHAVKPAVLGASAGLPHLINSAVGPPFLQLNKVPQTPLKKQTSLLGDPPKEIRLSTNPYLNLASVLPGICLPAIASKASSPPQQTGLSNNIVDAAVSQGTTSQHAMENYLNYSQQHGEYTQESTGGSYPDYSPCLQVMPTLYSGAQGSYQPGSLQLPPQTLLNKVRGETGQSCCRCSWRQLLVEALLICLVLPPSGLWTHNKPRQSFSTASILLRIPGGSGSHAVPGGCDKYKQWLGTVCQHQAPSEPSNTLEISAPHCPQTPNSTGKER
ncbi:ribonucleoprotein PTB-binding 2 isoform X9 [Strigops habroptila]|uniref:ribonucleoprotein PTB-binding 2 isoform X9 n=1 Tax=Strigops habroptila TaxID=2489341 RepID=UPI0011CFE594|nr:ribonucleoprotein PTB-binding 2 isoform X9 [Strigops habroptila]